MQNILGLITDIDRFYLQQQEQLVTEDILKDIPQFEKAMIERWWQTFPRNDNNIKHIETIQHWMRKNKIGKPVLRRVSKMLFEIELKMIS